MKTLSHQTQHLCYLTGKSENIMNVNKEREEKTKQNK